MINTYLGRSIDLAQEKRQQRNDDEIDAASEISQFVQLEWCGYYEEYHLHNNRYNRTDRIMINIQNVHGHDAVPKRMLQGLFARELSPFSRTNFDFCFRPPKANWMSEKQGE